MLDCSPQKIKEYSNKFSYAFGQLRTPLTGYRWAECVWALDNGCFTSFDCRTWRRLLGEAKTNEQVPEFVCLPDIVGNARRTLELFEAFKEETVGVRRALVLQDGIGDFNIPWKEISAVFVGGTDSFKRSPEAITAAKTAKYMGKWVHVGRVNTVQRTKEWLDLADSIDGSGMSRFDHMLKKVLDVVVNGGESHGEQTLFHRDIFAGSTQGEHGLSIDK